MVQRSLVVADDVPEICNLVAKFLEPFGYTVHAAASGREALQLLNAHRCNVLVTDVLMPDVDGVELIAETKKSFNDVRILAISGGGGSLDAHYCVTLAKAMGAHATMTKPFDRKQLLAAVEALRS